MDIRVALPFTSARIVHMTFHCEEYDLRLYFYRRYVRSVTVALLRKHLGHIDMQVIVNGDIVHMLVRSIFLRTVA
jgi:hypothetical protein